VGSANPVCPVGLREYCHTIQTNNPQQDAATVHRGTVHHGVKKYMRQLKKTLIIFMGSQYA